MWETNICYCPGFPEEHHRSRWLKNSCYFAVELTLTTEQEEPGFGQLPAPSTQLPLSFKLIQISLVFLSKALLLRYTLFSMKWVTEGLLNLLTFSLCTYCKSSRFEISKASINKNSSLPAVQEIKAVQLHSSHSSYVLATLNWEGRKVPNLVLNWHTDLKRNLMASKRKCWLPATTSSC